MSSSASARRGLAHQEGRAVLVERDRCRRALHLLSRCRLARRLRRGVRATLLPATVRTALLPATVGPALLMASLLLTLLLGLTILPAGRRVAHGRMIDHGRFEATRHHALDLGLGDLLDRGEQGPVVDADDRHRAAG